MRPNHELPVYNVGQDVFLQNRKLPRLTKIVNKVKKWVAENGERQWFLKHKKIQDGILKADETTGPISFEEYEKRFVIPQVGEFWAGFWRGLNITKFNSEYKKVFGVDPGEGDGKSAKREWEILKVENDKDDPNKVIIVLQHFGADGKPTGTKEVQSSGSTYKELLQEFKEKMDNMTFDITEADQIAKKYVLAPPIGNDMFVCIHCVPTVLQITMQNEKDLQKFMSDAVCCASIQAMCGRDIYPMPILDIKRHEELKE